MGNKRHRFSLVFLAALLALTLPGCQLLFGGGTTTQVQKPVADAGFDQVDVVVNTAIALDGSMSSGESLRYQWVLLTYPTGASTTIANATRVTTTYTPTLKGSYVFKLTVTNSAGNDSRNVTFTVIDAVVTPPVANGPDAPLGLSIGSATSTSLDLSWSASDKATSYQVYQATTSSGPFTTKAYDVTDTFVSATGLSPNTSYYFKVTASNTAGEAGPLSAVKTAKTLATGAKAAPKAPTTITFSNQTTLSIDVSWTNVTGATKYFLYRDDLATGDFAYLVYSGTAPSTSDTDSLVLGTDYFYRVKAQNSVGLSALSAAFKGSTLSQDVAPKTPQKLTIGGAKESSLTITWDSVTSAKKYTVYRLEDSKGVSTGDYASITANGVTATTYTDTGLSSSATFHYKVSASNDVGESPLSTNKAGTTLMAGQTPVPDKMSWATAAITAVGQSTLTLNWVTMTGATSYVIYRETSATGAFTTPLKTITDATTTSYVDSSVVASTQYFYKISAKNSTGEGLLSDSESATTSDPVDPPTAPSTPTPADAATAIDSAVATSFSWTASYDAKATTAAPLTYDFYRGSSATTLTKQNSTPITGTTYSIAANQLAAGTTYYWQVIAVNSATGLSSLHGSVWSFSTKAAAAGTIQPPSINSAYAASDAAGASTITQTTINSSVYLMSSVTDPGGYTITYSWTIASGSAATTGIANSTSSTATFTPTVKGSYSIQLAATNSKGKTAYSSVALTVIDGGGIIYGFK